GLLQLDLSIPFLEILAIALNFLTASLLIQGSSVALYSDSLTATDVLQRDSAKSTLMQVLTSQLYATDEFRSTAKFITISHCYGEGNPLADAASRGKARELMATCTALGIHPRRLGLSTPAQRFLASFVESARRLTAAERALSPAFFLERCRGWSVASVASSTGGSSLASASQSSTFAVSAFVS
ncbi:MAG: hypothetical protein AAF368_05390, partial [Planctomycetota bacterium]